MNEKPQAVNAGATKVEGSQEESAHRDRLSSSSVDATARLIAQARHWLESSPEVPYDKARESELDAQHHNEAYDLITSLLSSVDAVQVRVHQIEQERDEWKAILHSPTGAFGPEFARNLLRAALDQYRETREKLAATEARVSHLEQELDKATKGQWTQAESDAVKWRAQERSETWAHTRLRTALEIWADAIFTIDGTIAADNEELVEAAYALRAAAFPSAIPGSSS